MNKIKRKEKKKTHQLLNERYCELSIDDIFLCAGFLYSENNFQYLENKIK